MPRPAATDYGKFYQPYIDSTLGYEEDVKQLIQKSEQQFSGFLNTIPPEKYDYAYAPGKWTLKEVVQHLIDVERIMSYRALSVARGEKQSLPGFEENDYAANAPVNHRSWDDLVSELLHVRKSSILLFNSLTEENLQQKGTVNNFPATANVFGFIIVGHALHHQKIVKERYLG